VRKKDKREGMRERETEREREREREREEQSVGKGDKVFRKKGKCKRGRVIRRERESA
jgi:hypothetical protein